MERVRLILTRDFWGDWFLSRGQKGNIKEREKKEKEKENKGPVVGWKNVCVRGVQAGRRKKKKKRKKKCAA